GIVRLRSNSSSGHAGAKKSSENGKMQRFPAYGGVGIVTGGGSPQIAKIESPASMEYRASPDPPGLKSPSGSSAGVYRNPPVSREVPRSVVTEASPGPDGRAGVVQWIFTSPSAETFVAGTPSNSTASALARENPAPRSVTFVATSCAPRAGVTESM